MYNFKIENLKFKYVVDKVDIDLWQSWNFASMESIIENEIQW